MKIEELFSLMVRSVFEPAGVAVEVYRQKMPSVVIFTALILFAVLNVIIFWSNLTLIGGVRASLTQPLMFVGIIAASTMISAFMITHVGRALGGEGRFRDLLLAGVWALGLRVPVSAASTIASFVSETSGSVLWILGGFFVFWVELNFISIAHRLYSTMHALGVVIGAVVVGVIISLILTNIFGVDIAALVKP